MKFFNKFLIITLCLSGLQSMMFAAAAKPKAKTYYDFKVAYSQLGKTNPVSIERANALDNLLNVFDKLEASDIKQANDFLSKVYTSYELLEKEWQTLANKFMPQKQSSQATVKASSADPKKDYAKLIQAYRELGKYKPGSVGRANAIFRIADVFEVSDPDAVTQFENFLANNYTSGAQLMDEANKILGISAAPSKEDAEAAGAGAPAQAEYYKVEDELVVQPYSAPNTPRPAAVPSASGSAAASANPDL